MTNVCLPSRNSATGPVVLDHVQEEPDRLLEHRPPQLVVERREAAAIDAVVLLEPAEVEPVAAELGGQPPHAVVAEHPPGLGRQDLRAGAGRPPRRARATPRRACSPRGNSSGGWPGRSPTAAGRAPPSAGQVDPVAEVRRHQDARRPCRGRRPRGSARPPRGATGRSRPRPRAPRPSERPAIGPLGESLERLDVAGLGLAVLLLDAADGLGDDPELVLDRADRLSRSPRSARAFAR